MTGRAAALALVLLPLAAAPARAFVRATAQQSQLPSFWASSCEVVTIYTNGYTDLTTDQIAKSIAAAAHAWSPEVVTCPTGAGADGGDGHPSFEIITQLSAGGAPPPVGPDGKNVLVFRTDGWEYGDAIALTSRNTDPSGRIFDADIEVNADPAAMLQNMYVWANLDPNAAPPHGGQDQIDLQTALTHEFGHFLGLGHTCFTRNLDLPPVPLDDQGRVIPDCGYDETLPQAQAVMWWQVARNLTTKRVITADDARGVCTIYPPGAAVPVCAANLPDDGCGCRAGGPGAAGLSGLLALAGLLAARRRR